MESTLSRSDDVPRALRKTVKLPINLRSDLKDPLGEVVSEKELENILKDADLVVTIGDQCSLTLYEMGHIPDITIVDFMIKRGDVGELKATLKKIGQIVINVENPAGILTKELSNAVEDAYQREEKVRIEVSGEEDLATLPCVWFAPKNTAVIYGLPNIGLVVVLDKHQAKIKVEKVLNKMN
jgi:uncharacterized protein (UPF0218 family)